MKIISKTIIVLFVFILCNNVFGQKIKEVKIGSQVWMGENLNVDHFSNGDQIPEAKTFDEWAYYTQAKKAAWCYYDFDVAKGVIYGKLYNWFAIKDSRGLAISGWHIPSDDEWTELTDFLGGYDIAAEKLMAKKGWDKYDKGIGKNTSGFTALPGGLKGNYADRFLDLEIRGYWWSSTEETIGKGWGRCMYSYFKGVVTESFYQGFGLSVRCIKD